MRMILRYHFQSTKNIATLAARPQPGALLRMSRSSLRSAAGGPARAEGIKIVASRLCLVCVRLRSESRSAEPDVAEPGLQRAERACSRSPGPTPGSPRFAGAADSLFAGLDGFVLTMPHRAPPSSPACRHRPGLAAPTAIRIQPGVKRRTGPHNRVPAHAEREPRGRPGRTSGTGHVSRVAGSPGCRVAGSPGRRVAGLPGRRVPPRAHHGSRAPRMVCSQAWTDSSSRCLIEPRRARPPVGIDRAWPLRPRSGSSPG